MARNTLARIGILRMTVAATCLVLPLVAAAPAGATAPPVAAPGAGWVRFGHFAASAAPVDLYVDGVSVATGVAFKTVTSYEPLPAGAHTFEIRPAAQPDAPTVLSVVADVPDGHAITVGAVTTRDGLAAQVYDDALAPPPAGASLVRFIHSAPDFPSVDIAVIGGATIASQVSYPSATPYQTVAAGTYDLEIRESGTANVLLQVQGWSIQPGGQATVVIVRGPDAKLDVVPLADAAMAVLSPVGGVPTGFGGMALASSKIGSAVPAGAATGAAVLALCALAGLVSAGQRRRTRGGATAR